MMSGSLLLYLYVSKNFQITGPVSCMGSSFSSWFLWTQRKATCTRCWTYYLFTRCMLKIILKNIYYFNIILNKKTFKIILISWWWWWCNALFAVTNLGPSSSIKRINPFSTNVTPKSVGSTRYDARVLWWSD